MNKTEIKDLLQQNYKRENWVKLLNDTFSKANPALNLFTKEKTITPLEPAKKISHIGNIKLDENKNVVFFEVEVNETVQLNRNRVKLRNLTANLIDQDLINGALVIYYKPKEDDYRFSFIARQSEFTKDGEFKKTETHPKRFTYILGKNESCTTAAQRFEKLTENGNLFVSINDVLEAFNVEKLSKEFFKEYKEFYNKFIDDILKSKSKQILFSDEKHIRDFVKKMLGRIVFLYFVQKKGWLGASDTKYKDGDHNFIQNLFEASGKNESFYKVWLTKLFFDTLNKERDDDNFELPNGKHVKIPYLNGGLFEKENETYALVTFPPQLFNELFKFFGRYNFTIYEDSPEEQTVAVDPEMLGHIFENLLEDNKDKGAFYTPKEIVHYMTQESLIEYLHTHLPNLKREELEYFIKEKDFADFVALRENLLEINNLLTKVKICDPAIGSGAFPMGLLQEIFMLKELIHAQEGFGIVSAAKLKESIIQNSIYGVDIEKGAVDIARLRFWLSLVVDEEKPKALPNLDYKIMQGNSLLESYGGIDLSKNAFLNETKVKIFNKDLFTEPEAEFSFDSDKKIDIEKLIKKYFSAKEPFEKLELHKKIDSYVIEYIDKSLEFYENKLMIEISTYEDRIKRKTDGLNDEQKETAIPKFKETKEIAKRKEQLKNRSAARKELLSFEKTNERPYFLWHLFFMDVFENGGFDIVIGNPPYVDSETMTKSNEEFRMILKEKYLSATGNWDLFIPFIEHGINLSKKNGNLAYIIPNKLIGAKYANDLRNLLLNCNINEIRDYSRLNVFKEVNVYPITLLLNKKEKKNEVVQMTIMKTIDFPLFLNSISSKYFYANTFWDKYFFSKEIVNVTLKLSSFPALSSNVDNLFGAATVSEAYEIKKILKDKNETNLSYKKFINTGTIDRYVSLWGTKPTQYIKAQYLNPVLSKNNIGRINHKRLVQANSKKIIIAGMSSEIEAFFDIDSEYLAGKSTSIIIDDENKLLFLLGILNSKLITFFVNISYHSLKMSGGYLNISLNILNNLPIPYPYQEANRFLKFEKIVKKIISDKKTNKDTTALEQQIDNMVYKLYELTYEEVLIVQPNFAEIMSKKEYDLFEIEK